MKFFNIIFFSLLSITCLSQEDTLKIKKENDSIKIKKDNRFKVAGSVIANSILSVPGDFSAMGHNVSSNWKRTALYTAGIIGLIAVDKQTTGFLHDHIEPNIDYSLPEIKSTIPHVIGADSYIVYPIIGLYAGSLIINNEKGQVVALNAAKSLAYSYVITQIVLKTLSSRNRPQRKINDDKPVVEPWTKNPWDFGNYDNVHFGHGGTGTSFPSFHATSYFAVAKVFQMEYNNYWIPYTFVTAVFLSDIKSHEHWVSDLLVGGLVGTIIGRSIVISSRKQIAKKESNGFNGSPKKITMHKQLIPQISNSMVGLHFIGTF
ncbi:phosphatase PAP2 family protein [Flavobacterium pectinovorum]|uniref:phosphatase PAP2 family protein n=1 Tax=Flavobacterium pectinovorum TaxID=29533 RepID=UPI001FAC6FA1|nr:phosphatase PAP2 family protein [Flavobacterium pectinovorum]MCI9845823.1 phosphatase PAP2 family protein [Flavobacterium pectinovorum]